MPLLPSERFAIDVPAAPDEVRERLSSAVVSRGLPSLRGPEASFTGTIGIDSFELRPVMGYRNSFAPTARGSFTSGVAGTRVEVRLRMVPFVAVFMAFWLSFAAAFTIGTLVIAIRTPSASWLPLIGLAFFVFGYFFMTVAFSLEARRLRANLALLLAGTPSSELPRLDLSWLTDLQLRDAEAPERRFNRAFLGVVGVSGLLWVLAWERTVWACSSFQYHHRAQYSCPSNPRIALTWLVGAVLAAGVFASRVAIRKRARRAYVPLLVLVAALGAIAGWLIVHHPHWGGLR